MEESSNSSEHLCRACSKAVRRNPPWAQLRDKPGSSRVVLVWEESRSSSVCAVCKLINEEISFIDLFQHEMYTLGDSVLFSLYIHMSCVFPDLVSPVPIRSGEDESNPDVAVRTQLANTIARAELERSKFWKSVRRLAAKYYEADSRGHAALQAFKQSSRRSAAKVLKDLQVLFSPHQGSELCFVCDFMTKHPAMQPWPDMDAKQIRQYFHLGDFTRRLRASSPSQKKLCFLYHDVCLEPTRPTDVNILKVEVIHENYESWSAIRLIEYQKNRPPLDSSANNKAEPMKIVFRQKPKDASAFVPYLGSGNVTARRVRETVDVDVIKGWLRQCDSSHELCSRDETRPYPQGLILVDVQRLCLAEVKTDSRPHYLALSYVWGRVEQPVLTKAVQEQWRVEGCLGRENLPRTIVDAMQLTRMLGYDYIWIDALCIVQDDGAKRHHQITQMYDIYLHAELTVVAADGDNCAAGLAGVGCAKDRTERHTDAKLPSLCLMKVPLSTKYSIEASSWRARGWTFQEELCSRRCLIILPQVMVFSCTSAVWREDLQLKSGETLPRDEGLVSIKTLLSDGSLDRNGAISLYRDLVKQYMRRKLSRADDIENAFAGVAGMLEPQLGPLYHGIPEKRFEDAISGCWFWDTTLRRREGCPSWSWTGWKYRQVQADIGIRPLHSQLMNPLSFYKFGPEIVALGTRRPNNIVPKQVHDEDRSLLDHFAPDEAEMLIRYQEFRDKEGIPPHLIAFHTSCAVLKIRTPPGHAAGDSREYRVVDPQTNQHLTSIRLAVDFVDQHGGLHSFIVIAHDPDRRGFRLMLVSEKDSFAERVNVTAQSSLVTEEEWSRVSPRRRLIVMA